ncbi:HalD/BesD family halogenase [Curvivirga aplysinae]|uniref:HalD/BesD family halogenase n=1 Tax=Curvivirga aplysinae TaxID=2529852 RepID=UPI0012BBEEE1|nr:hypothetical protein [Curvivirga aplysinae]MTI09853.1 hypothetical protein [Curvivirga aplysinae]
MNMEKTPLKIMKNDPMDHIFDLNTYPIHDKQSTARQELVNRCRKELDDVGCVVLRDFVTEESLDRMQAEAHRLEEKTFWSSLNHNPYFTKEDESLPEDHPKRFFEYRSSGFIDSDRLEETSDLNKIYDSQILLDFLSECLNVSPLYCWADPLGNHPYGVMRDNDYFPWHFDGNDFTVSILVQESEEGGTFEYAPDIRNRSDENFDGVNKVLNGDRDPVHSLQLRPGDMQIFKGRFSMHRVTQVKGKTNRIIALPTYAIDPYTVNRPEHSKQVYGRALPMHYEREAHRSDGLTD